MGAMQDIFTGNTSTDIVTSNHSWLPYNLFVEKQHANNAVKAGPVKIITMGKSEVNRILDELGVIRRDHGSSENFCGVSSGLSISNTRRMAGMVGGSEK